MAILFLAIYIGLIFVRPMDWWAPVKDWQLVNVMAIATLFVTFPNILNKLSTLWQKVPVVRISIALWFFVTISFMSTMYLTGMLTAFQEFGKIIVLFLLILLTIDTQKNWRFLMWTILLCTAWMGVHSVLQIHTGYGFGGKPPSERPMFGLNGEVIGVVVQARAFGIFDDPNDMCLIFIVAIPVLYGIARASRALIPRVAAGLLIPLMGYAAWLTNSRGGMLGVVGMVMALIIARVKGQIKRGVLISVSLAFMTVFAPARMSSGKGGDVSRADNWGDGLNIWKRFPTGIGWQATSDYTARGQVCHNTYITALTELGIFGFVTFFILIYLTMVEIQRAMTLKGLIDRESEFYLAGIFSGLIGYLTSCYFITRTYNHVLYILLALGITQTMIACQTPDLFKQVFGDWRRDVRRGLLGSIATIFFIWGTVRMANAMSR